MARAAPVLDVLVHWRRVSFFFTLVTFRILFLDIIGLVKRLFPLERREGFLERGERRELRLPLDLYERDRAYILASW